MALNIKDRARELVVRELAALTQRSVTDTVWLAAEAALRRARHVNRKQWSIEEMMEIGKRCAALPDLDTRSRGEILGYDERGLPS